MPTRSHSLRLGDRRFVLQVSEGGEIRIEGLDEAYHLVPGPDGMVLVEARSGTRWQVFVAATGDGRQVFVDGEVYEFHVDDASRRGAPAPAGTGSAGVSSVEPGRRKAARSHVELLTVPMPARVVKVLVTVGQPVHRGDIVMKLEAMKMELPLRAPRDGTVRAIACREGDLVQPGTSVLEIA